LKGKEVKGVEEVKEPEEGRGSKEER